MMNQENKMKKNHILFFEAILCIVLFFVVVGCATTPTASVTVAQLNDYRPDWKPLFRGIDYVHVQKTGPEPQEVYAVRVDLHKKGLEFLVTPSNGDKPLETDGSTASAFLETHHCRLAVNATPFAPVDDVVGGPRDIVGLSISRGDCYSEPEPEKAAMLISRDNRVWFSEAPLDTSDAYNAVGGFTMLLEDNQIVAETGPRHPRTAAGTSQDGRYLYLVVIDGRQDGYSIGATTPETAEWMQRFGAYTALNLDGGGSTALVIADKNGRAQTLNRPIHKGIPGNQRINGNHLGIFVK